MPVVDELLQYVAVGDLGCVECCKPLISLIKRLPVVAKVNNKNSLLYSYSINYNNEKGRRSIIRDEERKLSNMYSCV